MLLVQASGMNQTSSLGSAGEKSKDEERKKKKKKVAKQTRERERKRFLTEKKYFPVKFNGSGQVGV